MFLGHGNREDNGVLDILREIELQFKPNNRDLSGQPMQPHIANALYTKVEALFQHGRPLPAIKKLDTVGKLPYKIYFYFFVKLSF